MSPLLHADYSVLLLKPRFSVLGYTPNSEIYIPSHSLETVKVTLVSFCLLNWIL